MNKTEKSSLSKMKIKVRGKRMKISVKPMFKEIKKDK